MDETRKYLTNFNLPTGDDYSLTLSTKQFPDGGQFRIEIPSTEGPAVLAAVLEEAENLSVPIHRISQGSGIMLLTSPAASSFP